MKEHTLSTHRVNPPSMNTRTFCSLRVPHNTPFNPPYQPTINPPSMHPFNATYQFTLVNTHQHSLSRPHESKQECRWTHPLISYQISHTLPPLSLVPCQRPLSYPTHACALSYLIPPLTPISHTLSTYHLATQKQPGKEKKGAGFISDSVNFITIKSLRIIQPIDTGKSPFKR